MAEKRTTRKINPGPGNNYRARVRMYRQGFGDCLLVFLPRDHGEKDYTILIDCGVFVGTPDGSRLMRQVMADVLTATGGRLDLLIATHEHWDHVSGFIQAEEDFAKLAVDETWLGWPEDPDDDSARGLVKERNALAAALRLAQSGLELAGDQKTAGEVAGLLGFFGAAGSTSGAFDAVREKTDNVSYKRPTDAPARPDGAKARLYVLGPPIDPRMLSRSNPSRSHPETYDLEAANIFLNDLGDALTDQRATPFVARLGISLAVASGLDFFKAHYFDEPQPVAEERSDKFQEELGNDWRRIDADWLASAASFALKLDQATNNTSLVLAIELGDEPGKGDVLLFAADAQVGNWLSWQDLAWQVDGRKVTGPDLIARTVLYKVGHHGSHNATLREMGLETMDNLQTALVPVDEAFAHDKRHWPIPLPGLMESLAEKAQTAVARSDKGIAAAPGASLTNIKETELWIEVQL